MLQEEKTGSIAVFIGRFQPFHKGHKSVVDQALSHADDVIVLIGSAFRPRSPKNPFTFEERRDMIVESFPADEKQRIHCLPIMDSVYDDTAWATQVRIAVQMKARQLLGADHRSEISLIGFKKDESSYYLKLFPEWRDIPVEGFKVQGATEHLSATNIREQLYKGKSTYDSQLPSGSNAKIQSMPQTSGPLKVLREEAGYLRDYRALIAKASEAFNGWPVLTQTVDAVVVQSGHILLVERGQLPGVGLWALPGGHLDHNETLEEAMIRELYEECRLDMPKGALKGRIKTSRRYDTPSRSEKARVITEAFLVELPQRDKLEKVKGGDDARRAFWVPVSEIDPRMMFEDHYDIIQDMLGMQQGWSNIYLPYLNS
jgi:bifunctional NMN adenylyltransferase/nudix hydrolase